MYKTRNLPNTRIDVADALRGIAVAGIILYHSVEHFDIFTKEPIAHTLPCDRCSQARCTVSLPCSSA